MSQSNLILQLTESHDEPRWISMPLKPSYYLCTDTFNFKLSTFRPHAVYLCLYMWIAEERLFTHTELTHRYLCAFVKLR